jgi:hypothetical protein
MKSSQGIGKLSAALSAAQAEMPVAKREVLNPHFKHKYADLAAIFEAARAVLGKHKLAVTQLFEDRIVDNKLITSHVTIETVLSHETGEWISSTLTLPVDKNTAQAVGSAITYGRRYALSAILGIATEDDDDGEIASNPAGRNGPPVGGGVPARTPPIPSQKPPPAGTAFQRLANELVKSDPGQAGTIARNAVSKMILAAQHAGELTASQMEALREVREQMTKGERPAWFPGPAPETP